MKKILAVTQKEFYSFFSSPIAYIFLGCFALVAMFLFFSVNTFFARNIADLRPLFSSMPLIMIFLVAAITMKMWSEERKLGTIEFLLTCPVKIWQLVVGKFLACLILVSIGLLLTVSLPLTVNVLGEIDWGPVWGAYLASLLLAASYIALGLFVSAQTENQIVALIITIVISFIFYIIGTDVITGSGNNDLAQLLSNMSTSGHFESVSRGIIKFSDLAFYLSFTGIFLLLNVYYLEKTKWSKRETPKHSEWSNFRTLLLLNLLLINFLAAAKWLPKLDLTANKVHTLAPVTKNIVNNLSEPLTIRAYISSKTHPLLQPLVPQVKDLLAEYQSIAGGKLTAEVIDPRNHPALEEEAGRRFNIKPQPLQVSDRYQASVVSAYFDILVLYGDKFEVLNFQDLIEIGTSAGNGVPDVRLKNLEYDLNKSIKQVVYGFQDLKSIIGSLDQKIKINAYISATDTLPGKLADFKNIATDYFSKLAEEHPSKIDFEIADPLENAGALAKDLLDRYGLRPMQANIFTGEQFYFYLIIENQDLPISITLPEELTADGLAASFEEAIERLAPGYLKTVGLIEPTPPPASPYGPPQGGVQFNFLFQNLSSEYQVKKLELDQSSIPADVDILLVLAPENLSKKTLFSIDQFLMRGGTVVLSTANHQVNNSPEALFMIDNQSGLSDWLANYGLSLQQGVVLDVRNEPFAFPVKRNLGGFMVEEIMHKDYPPFVEVRGRDIKDHPVLSGITQVTLNWPAAISFNQPEGQEINYTPLLNSSEDSWLVEKLNPTPDYDAYPDLGYQAGKERSSYNISGVLTGKFTSYFKDKDLDFLKDAESETNQPAAEDTDSTEEKQTKVSSVINKSAESAKIIVFASNDFLTDQTLQMSAFGGGSRYLNSLRLIQNSVDWSLEDPDLLSIRNRSNFSRTLDASYKDSYQLLEYANYLSVLVLLLIFGLLFKLRRRNFLASINPAKAS